MSSPDEAFRHLTVRLSTIFGVDVSPGDRHGVVTVRVHGDVDLATVPKLRAILADADRRGVGQLVVDLSDVDHMDSTGIGVLFGAMRRARQRGGDLRVSATSAAVAALFELLSLSAVFVDRCACNAGVEP